MEFNFNCEEALDCDENGFAILEGSYKNRIVPGFTLYVNEIIDQMGLASSQSQKLSTIITTSQKFFTSNDRIVIKASKNQVLGFLKVGTQKLYVRDKYYNYHNVAPLCVIDFYVYESCQRKGIGRELFEYMINFERKVPEEMAYQRPTTPLLNFLQKNYNLYNYVLQNNNYIVFDEFFNYIDNNLATDNSTTRAIRAFSGRPSPNNYNNNNYDNNNYQQNDINVNRSQNIRTNTPNLMNAGQRLIYNNSFDNKVVDKEVYQNPYFGFQQYYFKGNNDPQSYDTIYSKSKINLINDYLTTNHRTPNEYIKEEYEKKENSIANSNGRLNQLMNKIS